MKVSVDAAQAKWSWSMKVTCLTLQAGARIARAAIGARRSRRRRCPRRPETESCTRSCPSHDSDASPRSCIEETLSVWTFADVRDPGEIDVVRDLVGVRADPPAPMYVPQCDVPCEWPRQVHLRELREMAARTFLTTASIFPQPCRRVRACAVGTRLVAERIVLHRDDVVRAVAVALEQRGDVGEVVARAVGAMHEDEGPQRLVAVASETTVVHARGAGAATSPALVTLRLGVPGPRPRVRGRHGVVVPVSATKDEDRTPPSRRQWQSFFA